MSRIVDIDLATYDPQVRYPWEEWADGQSHEILQGKDYHCKHRSMKANVKREAKRRGKHGMAKRNASGTGLYVQFARAFSAAELAGISTVDEVPAWQLELEQARAEANRAEIERRRADEAAE